MTEGWWLLLYPKLFGERTPPSLDDAGEKAAAAVAVSWAAKEAAEAVDGGAGASSVAAEKNTAMFKHHEQLLLQASRLPVAQGASAATLATVLVSVVQQNHQEAPIVTELCVSVLLVPVQIVAQINDLHHQVYPQLIEHLAASTSTALQNGELLPHQLLQATWAAFETHKDFALVAPMLPFFTSCREEETSGSSRRLLGTNGGAPHFTYDRGATASACTWQSSYAVAAVCQRLSDDTETPLQPIFGRLLCRAAQHLPSLGEFLSSVVFPALIARQAWLTPSLWKGVSIAVGALWPSHSETLLQHILRLPQRGSSARHTCRSC
ncbi:hypothetical protein cyc_03174 [Cyclospora cayetanensis]|uniref:Symplekin C-terminal domain-containing protein n=1 Tax=Cyclospora cayetanensis TaxID=88456 RepID=A0A1D3CVF6_9EIME|nr:hypothetical protein cyc_03174 [Cyclospora cayetanensis]